MSKIEYRTTMPEGGYTRGVKYRDPNHFDGRPERGAAQVACEAGFPDVFSAYAAVGIDVSTIGDNVSFSMQEETVIEEGRAGEEDQQEQDSAEHEAKSAHEMTYDELAAEYERVAGKSPRANMRRDTMIAAIEG